jgi:two-component system OmpR family response regulator
MTRRILVVDDDPHIREVICFALENVGMQTATAANGADALAWLEHQSAELIILDVGMPEVDGLEVCRRVRRADDTPILFLSARDEEVDRIVGLEVGGDDYVTKPFSPRELVARVNAILKRAGPREAPAQTESDVLQHGPLVLDAPRFAASFDGAPVPLTALEFTLMRALAARPGIVFSRDRIMETAYVNVHVSDRTIDSHIRNIRAKFAALGCADAIETVHGVGFRLGALTKAP